MSKRKRSSWILAGVAVVLVIALAGVYMYAQNKAVSLQESVTEKWANVESTYQRRLDLIPNLVETVKGFASQEKDVFIGVTEARSKASAIHLEAGDLTAENIEKFKQAQEELSGALSRLLLTVERYPDLRSSENFRTLMVELEGTENRINVARQRYNEAVKEYNTHIRTLPYSVFLGGFDKSNPFEAESGANVAPKVEF